MPILPSQNRVTREPGEVPLTPSQISILRVLAPVRKGGYLSRTEISERSGVATCTLCPALGSYDPKARDAAQKRTGRPSLVTLGLVVCHEIDVEGIKEFGYFISSSGRELLASLPPAESPETVGPDSDSGSDPETEFSEAVPPVCQPVLVD